jgi:hypothetical protein
MAERAEGEIALPNVAELVGKPEFEIKTLPRVLFSGETPEFSGKETAPPPNLPGDTDAVGDLPATDPAEIDDLAIAPRRDKQLFGFTNPRDFTYQHIDSGFDPVDSEAFVNALRLFGVHALDPSEEQFLSVRESGLNDRVDRIKEIQQRRAERRTLLKATYGLSTSLIGALALGPVGVISTDPLYSTATSLVGLVDAFNGFADAYQASLTNNTVAPEYIGVNQRSSFSRQPASSLFVMFDVYQSPKGETRESLIPLDESLFTVRVNYDLAGTNVSAETLDEGNPTYPATPDGKSSDIWVIRLNRSPPPEELSPGEQHTADIVPYEEAKRWITNLQDQSQSLADNYSVRYDSGTDNIVQYRPSATFSVSVPEGDDQPTAQTDIEFDPSNTMLGGASIRKYRWEFRQLSGSTIQSDGIERDVREAEEDIFARPDVGKVTKSFEIPGVYVVEFTVWDENGASHTVSKRLNVVPKDESTGGSASKCSESIDAELRVDRDTVSVGEQLGFTTVASAATGAPPGRPIAPDDNVGADTDRFLYDWDVVLRETSSDAIVGTATDPEYRQWGTASGDEFRFRPRLPGTYAVSVRISDPVTGCATTRTETVEIGDGGATSWTRSGKLHPEDGEAGERFGDSIAVSGNGTTAIIGARDATDADGTETGAAYVFDQTADGWTQTSRLTGPTGSFAQFGAAVAVTDDGETALVGARRDPDPNGQFAGSAHVFQRAGDTWVHEQQLTPADASENDRFGAGIAITRARVATATGTTVRTVALVGAPEKTIDGERLGAAYLFVREDGDWVQRRTLAPTGRTAFGQFGETVAVDGIGTYYGGEYALQVIALVGEPGAGQVYGIDGLVSPSDGTIEPLLGEDPPADTDAGASLDIGHGLIGTNGLIGLPGGAPASTPSGADAGLAVQARYSDATWAAGSDGRPTVDQPLDGFGSTVAVSDQNRTALVTDRAGSVYAFRTTSAESGSAVLPWTTPQQFRGTAATDDGFGAAADVTGRGWQALVGAATDTNANGEDAGAVYLYERPAPLVAAAEFEAADALADYDITGTGTTAEAGTRAADAPTPGSTVAYLRDPAPTTQSAVSMTAPQRVRWNRTYTFEYVVRAPDYAPSGRLNDRSVRWRGGPGGDETIGLLTFATDQQGRPRPFQWTGNGVVSHNTRHEVTWEPDTWYRIRGVVLEEQGRAAAKIWRHGDPVPTPYQAAADVSTGVTTPLPFHATVTGDTNGRQATLELAHATWEVLDLGAE